jgi:hypothetical protein
MRWFRSASCWLTSVTARWQNGSSQSHKLLCELCRVDEAKDGRLCACCLESLIRLWHARIEVIAQCSTNTEHLWSDLELYKRFMKSRSLSAN